MTPSRARKRTIADSRDARGRGGVARDDRLLSLGALLEHPWSSQVHWVRWTEDEAERIDEVLGFFRRRRQAFVWLVTAKSTPASLGERLTAWTHSRARGPDAR